MDFIVQIKKRWRNYKPLTKFFITIGIIGLVLGIISLPPALAWYSSLFDNSLNPVLGFHMSTTGINLESSGSTALSFSEIHDLRVHTLSVENPNEIPLNNLELTCQFPEAVISVSNADPSASVNVDSYENWDKLSFDVEGNINKQQTVEEFGTRQITGLRVVTVNSIPALTSLNLKFVTTADTGAGIYNEWALKEGDSLSIHKLVWHVKGTYQFATGTSFSSKRFLLPLKYNSAKRTIEVGEILLEGESGRNLVRVRQAKGLNVPGYLETKGYILLQPDSGG